jgi:hypothetical protein
VSALTALARARAIELGRAVPIATVAHVHLAQRPLVLVPLTLAGEANAPLACLLGSSVDEPTLLVVPQPRNRDLRFGFAADLAPIIIDHIYDATRVREADGKHEVYADAPQVIVPNPAGIAFLRLFGRSTRFRRTTGEHAVAPAVPDLGRWLSYFAERAEHPGSSTTLAMTAVLSQHWGTGQSPLEDANLAALMGWIEPWDGLTGPEAAALAEDPVRWPPAGPTTDPSFDNEVLTHQVRAYDAALTAGGADKVARAVGAIEKSLRGQMEPTWRLVWRAIDLLRALPVGSNVAHRWLSDRRAFTWFLDNAEAGGPPPPKREYAVTAARRLAEMEREQDEFEAARALDDELVMAEYRISGEAFAGVVRASDPTRLVQGTGRRMALRPLVTVRTTDPVRFEVEAKLYDGRRPGQQARIVDVASGPEGLDVVVELSGGMGGGYTPRPGSVPAAGEELCYSTLRVDNGQRPAFSAREETPWTHGGPPPEYQPTEDDAREDWS